MLYFRGCRYAAAGYTEHMDDTGRVKQAPPFEAVAKDWGEIGGWEVVEWFVLWCVGVAGE